MTRFLLVWTLLLPSIQSRSQAFTANDLHRGAVIILEEVNFFSDQYKLGDEEFDELNLLVNVLKDNSKLKIEISSHTDIEGDPDLNLRLSEKRAAAVRKYLIDRGADRKRIHAIGKGHTKPLVRESSPLNQRIEVTVISNPHLRRDRKFDDDLRDPGKDIARQKRVALIIGNSEYQNSPSLRNPVNDAMLMSETLKALNFEVTRLTNLTYKEMISSLKSFSATVNKADVALFYFAGHGLQVNGTNYLLPTDARFDNGETDVPFESVNLELVLKTMEYTNQKCLNMVVLDACRNNPFKKWSRGGDGLAEVKAPSGTLIAYSTSPGSLASDGDGTNGLYTQALVEQLAISQRVEDIFMNTRIQVEEQSKGNQSPWELSKLRGKFYLK